MRELKDITRVIISMMVYSLCTTAEETVSLEIRNNERGNSNYVIPREIWNVSKLSLLHGPDFDAFALTGENGAFGFRMYFGSTASDLFNETRDKGGKILRETKAKINGDDVVWIVADIPLVDNSHAYWSWVTMKSTSGVNEHTGEVTGREGYQIQLWDKSMEVLTVKMGMVERNLSW